MSSEEEQQAKEAERAVTRSGYRKLMDQIADNEEDIVRDNAIGALSRLALAHGGSLPLDSMLPAILARLPLRSDPGENTAALRCLMQATAHERVHPVLQCTRAWQRVCVRVV